MPAGRCRRQPERRAGRKSSAAAGRRRPAPSRPSRTSAPRRAIAAARSATPSIRSVMPVSASKPGRLGAGAGVAVVAASAPMKNADAKNDSALTTNATLRPATRGHQAADRRAEREHRRPRRARQRVGRHQLLGGGDVGNRRGARRLEERLRADRAAPSRRRRSTPDPGAGSAAGRAPARRAAGRSRSSAAGDRRDRRRTPASGPTIATGRNCTIIIHATAVADPVRSSSSAKTATELNQSPSCEIVWPM